MNQKIQPIHVDVFTHGDREGTDRTNREILQLLHHLHLKIDALTEHLVADPAALKALTEKIAAKTAALKTAVDAATAPTAP